MQEKTVVLEASEAHDPESSPENEDRKQGWVRFGEDRHFVQVTGSDFRIWGEE